MIVTVVAAALVDAEARVLVARRPADKEYGGYWEFPGGKVDHGETAVAALARELREELDIVVDPTTAVPVGLTTHQTGDREIVLLLYAITAHAIAPRAVEHDCLAWVDMATLGAMTMPPGDIALLPALERHLARR